MSGHSATRLLLAVGALGLSLNAPVLAQDVVRIGSVLSVTGPASFLGEPEDKTLRMYVDKINAAVNKALADPAVKKQMDSLGAETIGGTPDQFAAYVKAKVVEMSDVAKAANLIPQ